VNALANNTLPQVSWLEPEPSESCHPSQGTLESCQEYVTSVIDDIEQSSAWNSSVTFLTWDEYGGYYDSVPPPQIDEWGDGFRVPLIVISPYTIQGLVGPCYASRTTDCAPSYKYYNNYTNSYGITSTEDFSAFLSTIEYNFGVKPIALRDAEEPSLFYMLNFSQTPLKPLFFSSNYDLARYPLSACNNDGGCNSGNPISSKPNAPDSLWIDIKQGAKLYSLYNASAPSWAEPNTESAGYSGGDPDD
jgi:hypothetical protein